MPPSLRRPSRASARCYAVTPILDGGRWYGRLPDGTRLPYDDGRAKSFDQRLEDLDLEDMFSIPYRSGPVRAVTEPDDDPGRIRVERLFDATYGGTRAAVDVVPIKFLGTTLRVHRAEVRAAR